MNQPSSSEWKARLLAAAQHALDIDRLSPEETGKRLSLMAPADAAGETAWRAAVREMLAWSETELSLSALWALIRRREMLPAAADRLLEERGHDPRWAHALMVALLVMRDTGTTQEEAESRVRGYRTLVTRVSMMEPAHAEKAPGARAGETMPADLPPTAWNLWEHLGQIDAGTALGALGDILAAHLTGRADKDPIASQRARERLWGRREVWGPVSGKWLETLETLARRDPAVPARIISALWREDPDGAMAVYKAWEIWRQSPDVKERTHPDIQMYWDAASRATPELRAIARRSSSNPGARPGFRR